MLLICGARRRALSDAAEDGVGAADVGPILLVVRLGVARGVELRRGRQHAAAKPNRKPLHLMREHVHLRADRESSV